jgi:hypothetical protein
VVVCSDVGVRAAIFVSVLNAGVRVAICLSYSNAGVHASVDFLRAPIRVCGVAVFCMY